MINIEVARRNSGILFSYLHLGLAVLLFVSLLPPVSAGAATLKVGGEEAEFESIGKALRSAASGDVIELAPGLYEESLRIESDVTLKGMGDVVLTPEPEGEYVIAVGPRRTSLGLEGLEIRGGERGLWLEGEAEVRVTNCKFIDNREGVRAEGVSSFSLKNSLISDNNWNGIVVQGEAEALIENSNVKGNNDGIVAGDRSSLRLMESKVTDNNASGVLLQARTSATLEDNQFADNFIYGLVLSRPECGFKDFYSRFRGEIEGSGNLFSGNGIEDFCPPALKKLG